MVLTWAHASFCIGYKNNLLSWCTFIYNWPQSFTITRWLVLPVWLPTLSHRSTASYKIVHKNRRTMMLQSRLMVNHLSDWQLSERFVALNDLAEDDVFSIEPWRSDSRDKELTAVGIWTSIGHAQKAWASTLRSRMASSHRILSNSACYDILVNVLYACG